MRETSKRVSVANALDFIDEWADEKFAPLVKSSADDLQTYCMMLKFDIYGMLRDVARRFGCEVGDVFSYGIERIANTGKSTLVDAGYVEVTTIGVHDEPGKFGYRFYRPFEFIDYGD